MRLEHLIRGKTFSTLDPRTGEVIANVSEGDAEDINRAVSAARKAFDEGPWSKMTAYERARIMLRFADLVEKNSEELAALETWDSGKLFEEAAETELPTFVRLFHYHAGWADKIHGLTVPADGPHHVQSLHEPIGVADIPEEMQPWEPVLLKLHESRRYRRTVGSLAGFCLIAATPILKKRILLRRCSHGNQFF